MCESVNRRRRFALFGAFVILGGVLLTGLLRGQPSPDRTAVRINTLIDRLGDDSFDVREKAGDDLLDWGDLALPHLRKALVERRDPEVRWRCDKAIRAIGVQSRTSKTLGLELVLIEAGEFPMGAPEAEAGRRPEEKPHRVKISRPFLLGVYEVTQEEYFRVMESRPSWFTKDGGGRDRVPGADTGRLPVERVSWFDAVEFCNRLSKRDGYSPYYELSDLRRNGDSIAAAEVKILGGGGYRLPSEAEWEFACRAGMQTPFHFGAANSGAEANVKPVMVGAGYGLAPKWADLGRTAPVGSYPANAWGLRDMHGNAAEWCGDWYDAEYYANSPANDPPGPATGKHRVVRGGSWLVHEGSCRSAGRYWETPDERKNYLGFRVARSP